MNCTKTCLIGAIRNSLMSLPLVPAYFCSPVCRGHTRKVWSGVNGESRMPSTTCTKRLSIMGGAAEADHERRELHEARERCWREHHRWWDEHEHRWREQRDWDERDHDRD